MSITSDRIVAFLDTSSNNASTLAQVAAHIGMSEADTQTEIGLLLDAGLLAFDPASGQMALTKDEGSFSVEDDPSIDPSVKAALAELFAEGGMSLSTFLSGLRAGGLDGSRARVGIFVARHIALGMAARRTDPRLTGPLLDAAALLGALADAFETTP